MDPGVQCFHPRNCFQVIAQVQNTNDDQNSAPKYGPNFSLKFLTNLQLQDVDQSSISPKNSAVTATFQHCPNKIINHPFQLDSYHQPKQKSVCLLLTRIKMYHWSKSNGNYVIKDFVTLPLIFFTSKYSRWKFQPRPSFFPHANIPDK